MSQQLSRSRSGVRIQPVFREAELGWLRLLDIAMAELGAGHRLAPQLSLGKILVLPEALREGLGRVLRHRVDFTVLDARGLPVAAIEVAAGSDRGQVLRWQASRALLEEAGVACFEITAATGIEPLFAWLAGVMGTEDETADAAEDLLCEDLIGDWAEDLAADRAPASLPAPAAWPQDRRVA